MLEVRELTKTYENQPLLRGISFQVGDGEKVCLLGPSGSGKTTLLRLIAGLERPESGALFWNGSDLAGVPVHKRQFGLMFQDYALFPHRNVQENVAFGLRMLHLPGGEIKIRVIEALEQVNLADFALRRVTDLSGGEQQRVALARALAPRPRLLMLDEPLGALDRTLREQLLEELRGLLRQTGIPAIYVTHDQEEAYTIADRLVLLHEGRVEQEGIPSQVALQPASPWVARFLGLGNLVQGIVRQVQPLWVTTKLGDFLNLSLPTGGTSLAIGRPVTLLFRPDGARLQPPGQPLRGRVVDCTFRGSRFRVELECNGQARFFFELDRSFYQGDDLQIYLPAEAVTCLA